MFMLVIRQQDARQISDIIQQVQMRLTFTIIQVAILIPGIGVLATAHIPRFKTPLTPMQAMEPIMFA
jgi:hypothetical protein